MRSVESLRANLVHIIIRGPTPSSRRVERRRRQHARIERTWSRVVDIAKWPVEPAFEGDLGFIRNGAGEAVMGIIETDIRLFEAHEFAHILQAKSRGLPPSAGVEAAEIGVGVSEIVNPATLNQQQASRFEQFAQTLETYQHLAHLLYPASNHVKINALPPDT